MKPKAGSIDLLGALASNAGDAFHEIWVMRKALELLDPESRLVCLTAEGIPAADSSENNRSWDGVDCALFYGKSEEDPFDRIEIVQLKYSPSAPEKRWAPGRFTKNTKQKGNNSVARRLADAFDGIIKECGLTHEDARNAVMISLVTNQPISPSLTSLVQRIRDGNMDSQQAEKLRGATGLPKTKFRLLCECLDLKGLEQSRASLEVDVIRKIGRMLDADARDAFSRVLMEVNRRMLPEGQGERITRITVESWFGVGWSSGLFPCEAKLEPVENLIERDVASRLAKAVGSNELVCFHGGGGHGKSSAAQGLEALLPEGSKVILYDCYGAGGYRDPSRYRHHPRKAFTQMSNELARKTRVPSLFPIPQTYNPDSIESFRRRLEQAADLIETGRPEALLVILIDAADNAVAASQIPTPADECFVHGLVRMCDLPDNVRIVISTRTSRKDSLKLPSGCKEVVCPPFSPKETARFLSRRFSGLPNNLVEDFHYLSHGNPRVQSSALASRDSFEGALKFLRPGGRSLEDIYENLLKKALLRAGEEDAFQEFFCAALSVMPSPAPATLLGNICGTGKHNIEEICEDLGPDLRVTGRGVEFANEDFEHFCEERGSNRKDEARRRVADAFYDKRFDSEYAAIHLFDALLAAGRNKDIFELHGEPDATRAITDPIIRHRTNCARLRASVSVVSQHDNDVEAVKTILVGAEALETNWKANEMLIESLDLSVCFCQDEICRLVLDDPEQRKKQGPLLAYLSREYALAGNAPASREALRRVREKSRSSDQDGWKPEKEEFVAVAARFYKNDGWGKAEEYCERYPELFSVFLKYELLKFIALSEGRDRIREIRQEMDRRQRWIACVFIKRCGGEVSAEELEDGINALMDFDFGCIDVGNLEEFEKSESLLLVDDLLFFAEICGGCGVDSGRVAELVGKILPREKRKIEHAMMRRPHIIDFSFRATLLESPSENVALEVKNVFQFPESQDDTEKSSGTERPRSLEGNIRDAERLLPFYEALATAYAKKPEQDPDGAVSSLLEEAEVIFSRERPREFDRIAEMISRRVFDLHTINGTNVGQALDFLRACPLDSLQLVMCNDKFFDKVAEIFGNYAQAVENSDSRATEKAYALIRISRLLLPASKDESRAYFEKALKIVEDTDYELTYQLDCLLEMAGRFSEDAPGNRNRAEDTARLVRRAGMLLGDEESFPKARSMGAVASLSTAVAACVLNRWADEGFVETDMYVESFLRKALSRKTLPESHVTALSLLAGDHGTFLTGPICESAGSLSESVRDKILAEVAGREMMNLTPEAPKAMSEQLERLAASLEESNATFSKLADTRTFLKNNSLAGKPATDVCPLAETSTENRQKPDWSGVDVLDSDAIEAAMQANRNDGYHDKKTYYSDLAERVGRGDQIGHLDALADIALSKPYPADEALHIVNCLKNWQRKPVKRWAGKTLPKLIVEISPTIISLDSEIFESLVEASGIAGEELKNTIVAAVERNAHRASSNGLLKYAAALVGTLPEKEAGEAFNWYVSKLNDRIDVRETSPERHDIPVDDLPEAPDDIAAAFLYRFLGDMDVRLRWRAAHSVRAFVRLGDEGVVPALVRHALATESRTYTFGDMPFHELTARLFLAMTLARIAFESPETVAAIDNDVLRLATDGPPHVMIEHYVKRALTQADKAAGKARVSARRIKRLACPVKGYAKLSERRVRGALGSRGMPDDVRFSFDILDTLPYWYDPALEIFADVSPEEFIGRVDHWIMDQLNGNKNEEHRNQDPRRDRFRKPVASRHGGGYLVMEPHPQYLEWHAMCVVVGELLRTRRLAEYEDDYELPFDKWLKGWDTLYEEAWLSDLRGPIPLERRYWLRPSMADPDCLKPPGDEDSLAELFTETQGELIISSYRETIKYLSGNQEAAQTVRVECSLVPPETAGALLLVFEAAQDPWYIEVPTEEDLDDDKKRIEKFVARKGALVARHFYDGFDSFDPARYRTLEVSREPGVRIAESLKLSRSCPWNGTWRSNKSGREICRYEAWSTQPNDDYDFWARSRSDIETDGFRLTIDAESLMRALEHLENDLIAVVKTRKSKGDYDEKDRKEARFVRVYILRKDGTVENSDGKIAGVWLPDSRGHRG